MRVILLGILLSKFGVGSCNSPKGPDWDGGIPYDAFIDPGELKYCPLAEVPNPDAGEPCLSSSYCLEIHRAECRTAFEPACDDAGTCNFTTCERAADCVCGSCVDNVCQPRPGTCSATFR